MAHDFSRREFLQSGAVAAGTVIASRTILAEPAIASASSNRLQPSDRVRFGIIGIQLAFGSLNNEPVWSPDGRRIVVS